MNVSCALLLMATGCGVDAGRVTWDEVRRVLATAICAEVGDSGEVTLIANDRRECGATEDSPLTRAVDAIFADANIELVPLAIDPPYVGDDSATADEITEQARQYYLSSAEYLRPVQLRLQAELQQQGLNCRDCPAAAGQPRQVSWMEFVPYLTAHLWPDPVVTPRHPDGTPSSEPRYSFHICAGLNGVSRIKDPVHLLVRAGFLVAMETPAIKKRAHTVFGEILKEAPLGRLDDDGARTEYLRKRMTESLAGDVDVKEAACATLQRLGNDLG